MKVIGIDPGKSGGIAIIEGRQLHGHIGLAKLTDREVWELLARNEPALCVLEKVHASPQMGVTSSFTFGQSFGMIRMAVIAAGLRLEMVTPQTWQKSIGLKSIKAKLGSAENKKRNKAMAQELFPGIKVTNATADALLIAEYGRRISG